MPGLNFAIAHSMRVTPRKEVSNLSVILRLFLYLCGVFLAVALVLVGIVVVINWEDEPLSTRAQDWLREPDNPVPDSENAFLAMAVVGIEGDTATATQRGRAYIAALRTLPPNAEDDVYARQGQVWQADDFDSKICSAKEDPNVLPRLLNQQKALSTALVKHQRALQRYYHAIALPGFHEVSGRFVFQNFGPQIKLGCLARVDLSQRLMRGDGSAMPLLVLHMRYSLHSVLEGQTLIGAMVGNGSLRDDIALLQGLRKNASPAYIAVLHDIQQELEVFSQTPVAQFGERIKRGEFRFVSSSVQASTDPKSATHTPGSVWERALLLAYQPQASTNLLRELYDKTYDGTPASSLRECDYIRFGIYNLTGKVMACIAAPDFSEYLARFSSSQAQVRGLLGGGTRDLR